MLRICSDLREHHRDDEIARRAFDISLRLICTSSSSTVQAFSYKKKVIARPWEIHGAMFPMILIIHPCWEWTQHNVHLLEKLLCQIPRNRIRRSVHFASFRNALEDAGPIAQIALDGIERPEHSESQHSSPQQSGRFWFLSQRDVDFLLFFSRWFGRIGRIYF